MIAAVQLGIVRGQAKFSSDEDVDIDYVQLDDSLRPVAANPLPQTVALVVDHEIPENESRPVITVMGEVFEGNSETPADVRLEVQGAGLAWFLAWLLACLSAFLCGFVIFSSDWFAKVAERRRGRRGGAVCTGLSVVCSRVRYWLRAQGSLRVSRMRREVKYDPTPRGFRNYLSSYSFSYKRWAVLPGATEAEMVVIAAQNSFVESVRAIDEGDVSLAAAAMKVIDDILVEYLQYEPLYVEKIRNKAVMLAVVAASETAVVVGEAQADLLDLGVVPVSFNPTACKLLDLSVCKLMDVVDCKLSDAVFPEGVDQTLVRDYIGLIRNLQLMFANIGTPAFLSLYTAYTGRQYPCIEEARAVDAARRKAVIDQAQERGEKVPATDVMGYVMALLPLMFLLSYVKSGGKGIYKLVRRFRGTSGGTAEAAMERLHNFELQNRLDRLVERSRSDTARNGDLATRPEPDTAFSRAVNDEVATTVSVSSHAALAATVTGVVDVVGIENAMTPPAEEPLSGELVSTARAHGGPLVAMRADGVDITVINADTDTPTAIRTSTLSSVPISEGVAFGNFQTERLISTTTLLEESAAAQAGQTAGTSTSNSRSSTLVNSLAILGALGTMRSRKKVKAPGSRPGSSRNADRETGIVRRADSAATPDLSLS